jgi:hypothetical protein
MTSAAARKGANAERELADYLAALTGWPVDRRLRQGRSDDCGDLDGLPETVAQVKNYISLQRAVAEGLPDLARQQACAAVPHGVLFVRRSGRVKGERWLAVMPADAWASMATRAFGSGR